MFLPVVGWILDSMLWRIRMRPIQLSICAQLERRAPACKETWGDNAERQCLGQWVADWVSKEMGFPNNNLVPDDSMAVLFFDDDGESIELALEMSEHWNLPDTWSDFVIESGGFSGSEMTLGEFVDTFLKARRNSNA